MKSFLTICASLTLCAVGVITYAAGSSSTVTTSVIATENTTILTQSDYRWYANEDALTPTTAQAAENTSITTPAAGTTVRLRMNILDTSLQLNTGATFTLQYANATSGAWTNLATSTAWIFNDNASVADGQTIVTTVLTNSTVGETYNESNPTAGTPNAIVPSARGEWDWVIQNNSADTGSNWFFRMIYSSSTALDAYTRYPALTAAATSSPPSGGGGDTVQVPPVTGGSASPPPPSERPPQPPVPERILSIVDLNGDNRVDMQDFSILLYYFERRIESPYDFNRDGVLDMADVSILLFYWTG